jgi:predicted RNase H-like nuclease (RuvC/YqgF family)
MGNELEVEIYQAKLNIDMGKRNLERMKSEHKRDIKIQNAYIRNQKSKLTRLEKKYFGRKRD